MKEEFAQENVVLINFTSEVLAFVQILLIFVLELTVSKKNNVVQTKVELVESVSVIPITLYGKTHVVDAHLDLQLPQIDQLVIVELLSLLMQSIMFVSVNVYLVNLGLLIDVSVILDGFPGILSVNSALLTQPQMHREQLVFVLMETMYIFQSITNAPLVQILWYLIMIILNVFAQLTP